MNVFYRPSTPICSLDVTEVGVIPKHYVNSTEGVTISIADPEDNLIVDTIAMENNGEGKYSYDLSLAHDAMVGVYDVKYLITDMSSGVPRVTTVIDQFEVR